MAKREWNGEKQRERQNAYQRKYRAEHPEKAREWHLNYVLRKAEKLRAEMEKNGGGEQ